MATKKKDQIAEKPKEKAPKMVNCQLPGAEAIAAGGSIEDVVKAQEKELNPAQDRFCREYIIDDNATRSYQRAYPNTGYDAARTSASTLLTNPNIRQRIDALREERNKRLEISADKVLRRLEARASVTLRDFYTEDGSFIPPHEMHPDIAIGVKSIEVTELFAGSGEERTAIGLVRKITINDGKASDELLGKNLGLWKEVGSKDNPLIVGKIELVALVK